MQRIFPPCRAGTGGTKVFIKVFDEKHLAGGGIDSGDQVKQKLQSFFDNLVATPNLPTTVAQNLRTFSFEVTYFPRGSTETERQGFGMMDFPLYLETTEGSRPLTASKGDELLWAHKIPETSFVKVETGVREFTTKFIKPFSDIEEVLKDDTHKELGVGIPGTYFAREVTQTRCRKVGMIKVNLIKRLPVADIRERKFIAVLKHELGHMFGIGHHAGTLMDENAVIAMRPENASYTAGQVEILTQTLTLLSQG
jgi:hypothetical protein